MKVSQKKGRYGIFWEINMGDKWDFSCFEKNMGDMGDMGEIMLFASIFSRTPTDFVLYFPIFLNEKQIEMDSMDE